MSAGYVAPMARLPLEETELNADFLDYAMSWGIADIDIFTGDGLNLTSKYMQAVTGLPQAVCATFYYLDMVRRYRGRGYRSPNVELQIDLHYRIALGIVKAEGVSA